MQTVWPALSLTRKLFHKRFSPCRSLPKTLWVTLRNPRRKYSWIFTLLLRASMTLDWCSSLYFLSQIVSQSLLWFLFGFELIMLFLFSISGYYWVKFFFNEFRLESNDLIQCGTLIFLNTLCTCKQYHFTRKDSNDFVIWKKMKIYPIIVIKIWWLPLRFFLLFFYYHTSKVTAQLMTLIKGWHLIERSKDRI